MKRAVVVLVLVVLAEQVAIADVAVDKATAEALFLRAKELEKASDFASACPLYEGSFRADPQLGALLNLANCHEQVGKLATAWAEFREGHELARRRDDARVEFARKRAEALAPRVSWLVIRAPSVSGLVVRRDTHDVTLVLGQELPIDPGTYRVSANAPDHVAWTTTVEISAPGTHAVVDVPPLAAVPTEPPPPSSTQPSVPAPRTPVAVAARARPTDAPRTRTTSRMPLVLGGAGLVVAGTGLVFGARAFSSWNASRDPSVCDVHDVCNAEGQELVASAQNSATVATYLVAGGGALVATAVVWWVIARSTESEPPVEVTPSVATDAVGVAVSGRF